MMNSKALSLFAIGLWLLTIVGLGIKFSSGTTEPSKDGRTAVILSETERDYVLGEMRGLLATVQTIVAAVAVDDMAKVANAARAAGSAAPRSAPPELMINLPLGFKTTGMSVHKGFDQIADAAEAGESGKQVLGRLGAQMGVCVGCHATYRLSVK